jgi:hypothetical protein
MLCHVDSYQNFNGSKRLHLQSEAFKEWTLPGLLDSKDEGATVIQNNGKYLQINSSGMLHPKRVKPFTLLDGFVTNMFCAH